MAHVLTHGDDISVKDKIRTLIYAGALHALDRRAYSHLQSTLYDFECNHFGDDGWAHDRILQQIVIPDHITTLGRRVFNGCSRLAFCQVPEACTDIGDDAFKDCTNLKLLVLPSGMLASVEPSSVEPSSVGSSRMAENLEFLERIGAKASTTQIMSEAEYHHKLSIELKINTKKFT